MVKRVSRKVPKRAARSATLKGSRLRPAKSVSVNPMVPVLDKLPVQRISVSLDGFGQVLRQGGLSVFLYRS